jgi:hypothetical protein
MKVFLKDIDNSYGFLTTSQLKEAGTIFFNVLDEEVIKAKNINPKLILIQFNETANWENIFKYKISLSFIRKNSSTWALTLDGAEYQVSASDKKALITKLLKSKFYKTELINNSFELTSEDLDIVETYPKYLSHDMVFGTFAIRKQQGFITSTRGKKQGLKEVSFVQEVDHETLTIKANNKATLNAPLLDKLFKLNPHLNYILHGHELIGKSIHQEYEFAGTIGDLKFATALQTGEEILLPYHGYIVGFNSYHEIKNYIDKKIWNSYQELFPDRYFQKGFFDEEVSKFLNNKKYLKVLDIGGGQKGTEILNRKDLEVYYLDPYIENPPKWIKAKTDWDTNERFDLIIARGCINYLSFKELERIPLLLNKGGVFMANSFVNPPIIENSKEVKNLKGEKGVETVKLENSIVKHQIKFKNYQVDHNFFYYSLEDYFKAFKVLGYVLYGKNSVILKVIN